jgi:hypothetical protein
LNINTSSYRIAIVHEWLSIIAGSEKVVGELLALYPNADLFTLVDFFNDEERKLVHGKRAQTSFIQRLPFAKTSFRSYLPLMPLAIEQFDVSKYDIVISSHHAVAKGVFDAPKSTAPLLLPFAHALCVGFLSRIPARSQAG